MRSQLANKFPRGVETPASRLGRLTRQSPRWRPFAKTIPLDAARPPLGHATDKLRTRHRHGNQRGRDVAWNVAAAGKNSGKTEENAEKARCGEAQGRGESRPAAFSTRIRHCPVRLTLGMYCSPDHFTERSTASDPESVINLDVRTNLQTHPRLTSPRIIRA
jgi:hypothetical protein